MIELTAVRTYLFERSMPRKGIGPAVASLCSPVETKPAIVIIDGEQRRKAKKWASPDIVTFAV